MAAKVKARPKRLKQMHLSDTVTCVPGFPGYGVDENGYVYTRKPPNGRGDMAGWRPMKPWPNGKGYLCITAMVGGERKAPRVHQLVMLAFGGPCPSGMEVLHGDGNRLNNAKANLRYGSRAENAADAIVHGVARRGVLHGGSLLNETEVEEIRRRLLVGEKATVVASDYGVSQSLVSAIKNGRLWRHLA